MNLQLGLDEPESALRERACKELALDPGDLRGFRIVSKSLDARRKRGIFQFVCHVELILDEMTGAMKRAQKTQYLLT